MRDQIRNMESRRLRLLLARDSKNVCRRPSVMYSFLALPKKAYLTGHREAHGRWTGKMPLLLATIRFSCFVVALSAMGVGCKR